MVQRCSEPKKSFGPDGWRGAAGCGEKLRLGHDRALRVEIWRERRNKIGRRCAPEHDFGAALAEPSRLRRELEIGMIVS
jgi:hypothetical protein